MSTRIAANAWTASSHLRWRQVALFVVAMLVPCTVLLILGARTIEQERQLEEDRLAKARQAMVDRIRQQLLSELETIKLQQLEQVVAHGGRIDIPLREPVAFVGALRDGELLLPWEHAPAAEVFKRALQEGGFAHVAEPQSAVCEYQYRNPPDARHLARGCALVNRLPPCVRISSGRWIQRHHMTEHVHLYLRQKLHDGQNGNLGNVHLSMTKPRRRTPCKQP